MRRDPIKLGLRKGNPRCITGCRRAVAVAELAIVLPFLSFMFMVAIDYCRVFYTTQTLWNCAHQAALYASGTILSTSTVSVDQTAKAAAVLDAVSLNPPLQPDNVSVQFGSTTVTVTVQYEFPMLTQLFSADSIVLQRSVTMNLAPKPGS